MCTMLRKPDNQVSYQVPYTQTSHGILESKQSERSWY